MYSSTHMHTPYSGKILRGSIFAHAIVDLYYFVGSIFAEMFTYIHYILCNRVYFASIIFVVRQSSARTAKIGPIENFPLYGTYVTDDTHTHTHILYR